MAPLVAAQKGEHRDLFEDLLKQGFVRARVDGEVISLSSPPSLDRQMRHNIEVVVDRLTAGPGLRARLAEAVDMALKLGKGNLIVAVEKDEKEPTNKTSRAAGAARVRVPIWKSDDDESDEEEDEDDCRASRQWHTEEYRSRCRRPTIITSRPTTPARRAASASSRRRRSCSASTVRRACVPAATDSAKCTASIRRCWSRTPAKSFKQGCIELLGPWTDMGRWKRHIYQGVADTLEHKLGLEAGTILETAWEELPPDLQKQVLYGTGDLHVTYTWRNGAHGHKYGGQYEGIIPELTSKYKQSQSGMQRRQLEKYMRIAPCMACHGARLNPQARGSANRDEEREVRRR